MPNKHLPRIAIATASAGNYIPFARVLASSLHEQHPDLPLFFGISDELQGRLEPGSEEFEVVTISELPLPEPRRFLFRHHRRPAAIAVKPYLLEHVLDLGFDAVLYIDVDLLVLRDLSELLTATERSAITLVPHLVEPLDGSDRAARELNILQSGVFNGGVLGVRESEEGRRFLAWWQARVHLHCRHAVADGLHFDQRWLDLVPSYFEDVQIFRDPDVDVAHWNLPERDLSSCRLFHFSGFDPDRPDVLTRYSNRLALEDLGAAPALFRSYRDALFEAGWPEAHDLPYGYDRFDNGVAIPAIAREIYSDLGEAAGRFGDPFATEHPGSFFRWLTGFGDRSALVSRLWISVHAKRPDLQVAYPDPLGADHEGFCDWTRTSGATEYALPSALV